MDILSVGLLIVFGNSLFWSLFFKALDIKAKKRRPSPLHIADMLDYLNDAHGDGWEYDEEHDLYRKSGFGWVFKDRTK